MDELQNMAKAFSVGSTDLSIAMAIYMLGFKSYLGFN